MEYFLREYAARSILPHLNTVAKSRNNNNNNYYSDILNRTATILIENVTNNYNNSFVIKPGDTGDDGGGGGGLLEVASGGGSSSENLYFIQPQQQLLVDVFSSGSSSDNIIIDDQHNMGVAHQYEDYTEYLNNDTSSPASALISSTLPSSSPALHLLASLASVTTTTISSITQQIKQHTEESFYDNLNKRFPHNDSAYAAFSCDGESQTLNISLTAGNFTGDASGGDDEALSSIYFKTAVYLLYIPIFVFALLGNGTVCYIVQSTPRMRTVTNYFIANLAVGDILMSLFCVPSSFISIFILGFWPFGIALCHFVNYSQAVSVLVSAYTLVAISIDRYIAIMWPLRPRITKRYAKFIIAGIWIIALATAFPILIVSKLVQPAEWHVYCDRYVCQEEWVSKEQNYYYTWALLTLQFLVPLSVLIFTYTRIALAVWGKRPPGEAENLRDQRMARSKRKMIKMMVTVVIVFTMCWLPFNILILLLNNDDVLLAWGPLPYFWFAFHWLAMSHSCYNPIIYCYMNARFRGGFLQIIYRVPGLRRCCCLRRYLRTRGDRSYEATGTDDAFHLQRVNTCTTYISTRRKLRTNSMHASQSSCAETTVLR
ncbi:RYamide receptor isoform 2-T6 [Cochliomyia hominivorax]